MSDPAGLAPRARVLVDGHRAAGVNVYYSVPAVLNVERVHVPLLIPYEHIRHNRRMNVHRFKGCAAQPGRVSLSRSASGRSMNINPRGVLLLIWIGFVLIADRVEGSPSGHGLRGLSVLLEHVPQERRQVPEERNREELHLDMEVGAEARPRPRILRRGSEGCPSHIRRLDRGERGRDPGVDLGRLRA